METDNTAPAAEVAPAAEAAPAVEAPAKSEPTLSDLSMAITAQAQILQELIADNKAQKKARDEAKAAAEAKEAEQLPEIEKMRRERQNMEMERKAWEIQRNEFAKADLQRAKDSALDKIGVLPQYRQIVPDSIDPRTKEGAAQLETFFADKPAMLKRRDVAPPAPTPESAHMPRSFFKPNGKSTNGLTSLASIMQNRKKLGLEG